VQQVVWDFLDQLVHKDLVETLASKVQLVYRVPPDPLVQQVSQVPLDQLDHRVMSEPPEQLDCQAQEDRKDLQVARECKVSRVVLETLDGLVRLALLGRQVGLVYRDLLEQLDSREILEFLDRRAHRVISDSPDHWDLMGCREPKDRLEQLA
jgi:hypothetical protein